MDWAIDTTDLIITRGTCCGQEARSVNNTSGGRSDTQSCWWVVDQTCVDPIQTPTPEYVVFRTFLLLTCTRNANHCECLQFRRRETTAVQCGLETVLVSLVLSSNIHVYWPTVRAGESRTMSEKWFVVMT